EQAPPSPDYLSGPKHPPSLDYVSGPEEPEQAPLSPDYVPEPEYLEYLVPSDAEEPMEDQPLPDDASPAALSPGYIADSDLEEDPEEDPKEDPADGGDDDDDDSSDDDDDNDDDVEEDEEDEEVEEHLAPSDSFVVPTIDLVPLDGDTEAFETDESAPTPVPSPRRRIARMSVRPQIPMSDTAEALIAEYASAPTPPSPPPSPLSLLSSPLPQIPSPALPLPSPPTTGPTYAKAPLDYRAAGIRLRAVSPPTHHPSEIPLPPLLLPSTTHRDDLPEADRLLQKRAHFTAPTSRFEIRESSSAAAARQVEHTLAHIIDYGFINTMDASIRATEIRAMIAVRVVNDIVTDLATTQRQDAQELYMRCEDARDDRALLGAQVSILRRERRYFSSMASSYECEAVIARQAWSHSESRIQAMEAHIRALQRDVDLLQRQRIRDEDRLTAHIQHEHVRFRELIRTAEAGPQDGPEDAGSSF
ncbi:hypothetical protein Tco_1423859, partial [Tanacetum coccineum]